MIYDKIFLALLATSSAHAEASRKVFAELGLTEGQPKVLYILNRQDGYVQKDLAEVCGIRQSTLTVLLTKLEKQNFIEKRVCYVSGGKHANRIYLTGEGRDIAERLENAVEDLEQITFKGFSTEEREGLLKLLSMAEENIREG